jgi:hypothetical protein
VPLPSLGRQCWHLLCKTAAAHRNVFCSARIAAVSMFRAAFTSARVALAPRLLPAVSRSSALPSVWRAGIQFSRVKPHANASDASDAKPQPAAVGPHASDASDAKPQPAAVGPHASDASDAKPQPAAVGPHASETSLAPPTASQAPPPAPPASAVAPGEGSSTDKRVRDSRSGIIRCAHLFHLPIFKRTRFSLIPRCYTNLTSAALKRVVQPIELVRYGQRNPLSLEVPRLGLPKLDFRPESPKCELVCARASLTSCVMLPCLLGESKLWSQLNAVERQSAEWLGYDEQRWKVHLPAFFLFGFSLV